MKSKQPDPNLFTRNSGTVLLKITKLASLITSRITFCVTGIIFKKSGLELDQS